MKKFALVSVCLLMALIDVALASDYVLTGSYAAFAAMCVLAAANVACAMLWVFI